MDRLENRIKCFLEENFDLDELVLPKEYRYSCFPLCLLDAIFSIGATYTSTENTVHKYCDFFDIHSFRENDDFPPINEQHTISQLIQNITGYGAEQFAHHINQQRTSSKNGILKAEAVLRCAKIFQKYEIETLQDFSKKFNADIENMYLQVPGQHSGISLAYLKMLCGNEKILKPDRHILRFLSKFADREVSVNEAQKIVDVVVSLLKEKYPHITVRSIDYKIWEYTKSSNIGK